MANEFVYERRVEFAETDMAGILHFSNYFRYMEEAEHAFFRSLGLRVHTGQGHGDREAWGFARGRAECTYRAPLAYEETVQIHLKVLETRHKSIRYGFRFTREDGATDTLVANGEVVVVCVERPTPDAPMRSTPLPAAVSAALSAADDAGH